MADGSGGTTKPSGSEGDGSSIDPSSALSSRQSKSSSDMFLEFSELENMGEDKNSKCLVCRHCKCKVLKPGYGTLLERELFLPSMTDKYNIGTEPLGDQLTQFWLVVDMFHFENVGFSKNVNQTIKYLICADCERGPIGWHDVGNKKEFLVAAKRVQYSTI